jgi:protein-S-isoprenylcysteine O-methyltransferase Ste14
MALESPSVLWRKSFAGVAFLQLVLAVALFAPTWTLRYWQAWAYWSVFLAAVVFITIHFLKHDPDLIRRRLVAGPRAERRPTQVIVQTLASLFFIALFVVSALDRRFRWSSVPAPVSVAADALVLVGFAVVFLVFRENSHTSAIIEVSPGQRVVTTGPYRRVRHPMYAGALLLLAATPLALGSLAALPLVVALAGVLVSRIVDEERLLSVELPGYRAYCREVPFRLIPHVW